MSKFTKITLIICNICIGYIIGGIVSSSYYEKPTPAIFLLHTTEEPKETIEHAEYLVTATVYHAVKSQCDDDYLTTASGRKIKSTNEAYSHRYIAVSRDLRELFPYGCKVEVIGTGKYDGIYTVADTMNKRYTEYIDILINPGMPIGKWENVVIKKLN